MRKSKKLIKFTLIGGVVLLIAGELVARFVLGLGDPPLYRTDPDYEYIQVENQDLKRFGQHYFTNEFAMRSLPLSDTDAVRILKIGDSVINGGAMTDHDSLASTLLEKRLQNDFATDIRVLNISSGSWGPDNAAAFLKKHGDFDAKAIVLVFSSHDLFDNMSFKGIVGNNPSFPDQKPLFALQEGIERYLLPRFFKSKKLQGNKINGIDTEGTTYNSGWAWFADLAKQKHLPILAVVHPTLREVEAGAYNEQGTQLVAYLDSLGIPTLLELNSPPDKSMYRDDIHYNEKGQRFLFSELLPWMKETVDDIMFPAQTMDTLVMAESFEERVSGSE
ncbi:MAG: hypothetical protein H6581_03085 [Bacteroidia bacterium]|nr:hypothetical protein [Bacteroidia bacterium]